MKPVKFDQANTIFTSEDPEVGDLQAFKDEKGHVVSCWELEPGDFAKIAETKKVWLHHVTGNQPLQPISLHAHIPLMGPNGEKLD
jgi:hypothetical protein